jgi:protein involved in polysaccharide export with SLBB domain
MDKVYVFGQVPKPGAFDYEPDRRVLDYLARAGGPGARARATVVMVRGNPDKPEIIKISTVKGMRGRESDNPIMQPGDVLYVPEGIIADWRDLSQIISTIRLLTLF